MITKDKVTEIFCIIDEFDKNLNVELSKNLCLPSYNSNRKRCRNRKSRLSESNNSSEPTKYNILKVAREQIFSRNAVV